VFPLHATRSTPSGRTRDLTPHVASAILLDTDARLPQLPIHFDAMPSIMPRSQGVAPFNPYAGYRITTEDLDAERREEKLARLSVLGEDIPGPLLEFCSVIDGHDLYSLGLSARDPRSSHSFVLHPEVRTTLASLRLQLFFPGMRLQSRPEPIPLRGGDVVFHNSFYPFDIGPLATPPATTEGIALALPADRTALSQIEARFVLC
jgi:hypothetical protein